MDALSVAEIKKKFDGKRVMVMSLPKMPVVHNEPTMDSSDSERLTKSRSNDLRRTSGVFSCLRYEKVNYSSFLFRR